ncbi:hypothetical protein [Carboxylicivirga sp. RSCT41]|uniref:hypothetical protein n=1 Tax=Carboxylicivirga agarovorans TaxID=3417570 RepID=UPI003D32ECF3
MKHSTLNILLIILLILIKQSIYGQSLYEPFLIIKDNFLSLNYNAKNEYCFYLAKPKDLINNPEFRASILSKYEIKSIKHIKSTSNTNEFFDKNGHLSNKDFYINNAFERSYEPNYKFNRFLFISKSPTDLNTLNYQELFKYNSRRNLIKFSRLEKYGFLKKRFKREINYKYNSSGDLLRINGIKELAYNEMGKLRLEKEINIYGEKYSKINRKQIDKARYANRQFKVYVYNAHNELDHIEIKHYDSISFKNYRIDFEYDDLNRLTKTTKYHPSGKEWKVKELIYSDGNLTQIIETMYSGTSDSFTEIVTIFEYKNGLISKSEEFFSNKTVKNRLREEIYYEYTFFD